MKRLGYVLVCLIFVACQEAMEPDQPPTSERLAPPVAMISDGAHGGNSHFYWLPPMVPEPTYDGTFDGSLSPVVEICEWTGTGCVMPLLARFTTEDGPGSETVRVVPEDEHYIVNWHTDRFSLDPDKTYRIYVRAGLDLGYADCDVIGAEDRRSDVDRDKYVPVENGRTLPIKFRIEGGAALPEAGAIAGFDPDAVIADDLGYQLVVNQLLISFQDDTEESSQLELIRSVGGTVIGYFRPPNSYQVEFPFVGSLADLAVVTAHIREDTRVLAAAKHYFFPAFGSYDNDDPQSPVDTWAYREVSLSQAWQAIERTATDTAPVTVAIIDDGLDLSHPEFAPIRNFVYGWRVTCATLKPKDDYIERPDLCVLDPNTESWSHPNALHGTQVGGVIGAPNGNGVMNGILGPAAGKYTLLIYDVKNAGYPHDGYAIRRALELAISSHVDVVNMSFGYVEREPGEKESFERFLDYLLGTPDARDIIFVAGAGNEGGEPSWSHFVDRWDNFVQVSAVEREGGVLGRAEWEICQAGCVCKKAPCKSAGRAGSLAAPGTRVATTKPPGEYVPNQNKPEWFAGTSAATPIVAGIVALARMVAPEAARPEEILQALYHEDNTVETDEGTWYVADACKTVAKVSDIPCPPVASVTVEPPSVTLVVGEARQLTATLRDAEGNVLTDREVTWSSSNPTVAEVEEATGVVTGLAPGQAIISAISEGVEATITVTVASAEEGWTATTDPNYLFGVWGSDPNNVFVVGYSIHQFDGQEWRQMSLPPGVQRESRSVWGLSASDVYAAGDGVLYYDGNSEGQWTQFFPRTTGSSRYGYLLDVWGSSPNDVYVVGSTAGVGGVILHWNGAEWTELHRGAYQLFGVWGSAADDVFAVGTYGTILHYDGNAERRFDRTTTPEGTGHLHDIWGTSHENVYAVGSGVVLQYDGGGWTQVTIESAARYNGIWGISDTDIWLSGIRPGGGAVFHYDGSGWQECDFVAPETSGLSCGITPGAGVRPDWLHHIWAHPNVVFTVGWWYDPQQGVILRGGR